MVRMASQGTCEDDREGPPGKRRGQHSHQREADHHQPQRLSASVGQGAGKHTEQNGDGEERE